MPRPRWHKPDQVVPQAPLDISDLPPGKDPKKLKLWFQELPTAPADLRRILIDSEWHLRRHARLAVAAAAGAGNLQVLQWLDEVGLPPRLGGGRAVRAAAKDGHLEVLRWMAERGLEPTEGLRWAARIAAQNGHLETLQWLWANGLADQFRAAGGLVRGAAQGGHLEVLKWIQEHGLQAEEGGVWSARLAAQAGDVHVVRWLFENGMTMKTHGLAALRGAAAGGHLVVLKWLAEQIGAPSIKVNSTVLAWAASEGGHLEVLQWLYERGMRPAQGGGAAIWVAARGGHLPILEWFQAHGVLPVEGGPEVVRAAVKGGYLNILRWLVENGVDVRDGGSFCGPQTAAEKGHLHILQWLNLQGMDLEKVSRSLIFGAAKGGHISVLKWLCEQKQVEIDTFAKIVVQEASAGGHKQVLQWLLGTQTSLSEGGWEAVQAASVGGHLDLLKWLSKNGLPVLEHGRACAVGAAKGGHLEVLGWLKAKGFDFNTCARAVVQEAAGFGHVEVLKWLWRQDVDLRDGGGGALVRAAEGGHLETLRYLAQHGLDLQEHWHAMVWAASDAMQPDVHQWLLDQDSRDLDLPSRASRCSQRPTRVSRSSRREATPRVITLPTSFRSRAVEETEERNQSKEATSGVRWLLQHTLDESEDIFDELQRAAKKGSMEVLHWVSTIIDPRWSVKMAVQGGHLGVLQWLVRHGLDLRPLEEPAVRWAAEAGHVGMLRWFASQGMKLGSSTIEAAASRGTAVVLEVLRDFHLPLARHPSLAEDIVPFLSRVTPTLLANFILVPSSAAESALESVLAEATVIDHRGRRLNRACMSIPLRARSFLNEPAFCDIQRALAPPPGTHFPAETVPVKICRVMVPGAIAPVVLRALAVTPRLQVFNTLTTQAIILAAWRKVRLLYFLDVLLELAQLAAVVHLTFFIRPWADELHEYEKGLPLHADRYLSITLWFLLVMTFNGLARSLQRISVYCQCGWGRDLLSLGQAWEWFCLSVMGAFLCLALPRVSVSSQGYVLSLLGFTRWWSVLYCLRAFDYFGQRILPILGAFREVLPFLCVMIFYGGALMNALAALSANSLWNVVLSFCRLGMTGEVDLEDNMWGTGDSASPQWWLVLQQVWFVAGIFLFTVALMNIFIAIMSGAFDRRNMRAEADFMRARATICLSYATTYEAYAGIRWRICKFFRPLASPSRLFSEDREVVWLCHKEGPRCDLASARSLREMLTFASETVLSEMESSIQAQGQRIRHELAEQLRSHQQHQQLGAAKVVVGDLVKPGRVLDALPEEDTGEGCVVGSYWL